ncbi:MAG: response regulator [Proteobacteria bacterium]|nr:response regulator [Pseudomonadota bacterium]
MASAQIEPDSAHQLLVVDDDPDFLTFVAELMESAGHRVQIADSGAEALSLLKKIPDTELIISDLSMPGMDGVELIQRARQCREQLPAILLTGLADNGAANPLSQVIGGDATVLCKPVNSQVLLDTVLQMLGQGRPA